MQLSGDIALPFRPSLRDVACKPIQRHLPLEKFLQILRGSEGRVPHQRRRQFVVEPGLQGPGLLQRLPEGAGHVAVRSFEALVGGGGLTELVDQITATGGPAGSERSEQCEAQGRAGDRDDQHRQRADDAGDPDQHDRPGARGFVVRIIPNARGQLIEIGQRFADRLRTLLDIGTQPQQLLRGDAYVVALLQIPGFDARGGRLRLRDLLSASRRGAQDLVLAAGIRQRMHRAGQLLPRGIEQIDHAGRRLVPDGIGGWRWFRAMGGYWTNAGGLDVLRRPGLGFGVDREIGRKGSGGMYGGG